MRTILKFLALTTLTAALALAQSRFSDRLTPDERRAAGLDTLTPVQIAALDALVAREARAPEKAAAASAPAAPANAARPALNPAEAAPDAKADKKAKAFGLPEKENVNAITGTLLGEYRGWNGNTLFRLEDGQIWMQTDRNDTHETTPRQNVRVKIEKSMFGGYKLTAEGDPMWVRVRRVQ